MELYETTTNGTKPSTVSLNHMGLNHHKGGINETSISGGEDELISNKSDDRFSGQTDYEMVTYHLFMIFFYLKLTFLFFFLVKEIPPASMMTLDNHHHHHLSMLPNGLHIQTSMSPGTIGGMSTYLIDESSANLPPPPLNYPNNTTIRYSSLGMQPFLFVYLFFLFVLSCHFCFTLSFSFWPLINVVCKLQHID